MLGLAKQADEEPWVVDLAQQIVNAEHSICSSSSNKSAVIRLKGSLKEEEKTDKDSDKYLEFTIKNYVKKDGETLNFELLFDNIEDD